MSENDITAKGPGASDLRANGTEATPRHGARKAAAKVQEKIDKVAGQLAEGVTRAGATTRTTYDATRHRAKQLAGRVNPIVTERPYSVAGLAFAAGLAIGFLLRSSGPKVIYVKPRE